MSAPEIALAYGYWSQNIGNAFFQVGGSELLRRANGGSPVKLIQDVPAHWTLHRKRSGNPDEWWNSIGRVEADFVVFQGPSLDRHSEEALDATLQTLVARGVEPVFLSIGMMAYTAEEATKAIALIDRHRIRIVVTRDRRTNALLDGRATYDGIDSAFFLPWAVSPVQFDTAPYAVSNFDRLSEPWRLMERAHDKETLDRRDIRQFRRRLFNRAALRSQAASYVLHRTRRANRRDQLGALEVVRPVHRSNPSDFGRFFKDSNSVVADEPFTYIAIYAGAEVIFTDRVHAAVVGLSYDRPVQMLLDTPRNALLERVGVTFPMVQPLSLPVGSLEVERQAELDYLCAALRK